jgi:putative hydrolase of the HAD superfamily
MGSPTPLRGRRPVRAVFFDAGNTLLRMDYEALAREIRARGTPVTPAAVRAAEIGARVRLDAHLAPGASTESQSVGGLYLRYVLELLGVSDPAVVDAIAEWRRDYNRPVGLWNRADPQAAAALAALADRGVRAAVISNSNGSVRSILTDLGLARRLEFVIDSAEVGFEKPDPRIFQLALERAGLEPEDAVYVGDLYSVDVLGARGAGLEAMLMDPGGCWGQRDCPRVPDLLEACRLALQRGRDDAAGGVT